MPRLASTWCWWLWRRRFWRPSSACPKFIETFFSLLIWTLVRQLFISNSVRRRLRNDRWWGVYEHGQAFCISHAHCGVSMGASTVRCRLLSVSPPPPSCRRSLCFWLCLSMAVIRWKTQGNRFDSLRPKANEIENIRESCEPKLNRRRLQSTCSLNLLSGRCIIKHPFQYERLQWSFPGWGGEYS